MKKFLGLVMLIFMFLTFNTVLASACPFSEELALGSKNESVGILQSFMLNTLKIYNGPVTNYYGPLTMASVKIFQENSGLLQTGKVDQVTASALCKIYLSYKVSEPISDQGSECFIKTLGIQKGFFEEANNEVKELQKYLNRKGYYPENIISGYFGVKTESALKLFQSKNNISPSGIVDDVTFKAICGYESNQSSYCPFVTPDLSMGYFEEPTNEVKVLQLVLNKLGVLEEKYMTGYFGKLTSNAVKAMQTKSNLSSTGILNLETRQVLCKLMDLPMKTESSNPYESSDSKLDLTLSGVSILPEAIDVKTQVAIVVKIKNIGLEDSKAIKGSLYMNDKEIVKANISSVKINEESVAIVHNWTCEQKGIYALKIFIDSENSLIEKNKYNNILVLPINCGNVDQKDYKYICNPTTKKCDVDNVNGKLLLSDCQKECGVDAGLPDLTITSFIADKTTLKPEEVAMITIVEKNIGKSTADYHKVKMTTNSKPEEADWGPLDPGSSNTYNQVKFTCMTPGIYNIVIETDSNNTIKESNEKNNSAKLTINCTDKNGKVVNTEPGKENDGSKQPPTDPASKTRENPTPPRGTGEDTNTPPGTEPEASLNRGGACNATTKNLNVGAASCTTFSGRKNDVEKPPLVGYGSGYFNLYPLDTTNCVDKKNNITGKCDCCYYYRSSPHRAEIVLNDFYCDPKYGGDPNCAIDFGDGSPIEKWTEKDREYIDDGNAKSSTYSTKKVHYYTVPAGKEYAIFCPKLIVHGKYYKLSNSFVNDYEDKEKCIIVFTPNFVNPPYHPGIAPYGSIVPGQAECSSQVNFAGNNFSTSVSGNTVTVNWTLSVLGGEPYLKKCPAVCVVNWGDGSGEQVYPCPIVNSLSHFYEKAGTYTIMLKLNGYFDQDPNSSCISRTSKVTIGADSKDNPKDKRYNCVNKKCVITEGGPYKNDTCDGECAKSDTPPPPTDDKNDIGLVCEVKQTAKPIFEAVSVEMTGKIKSPGSCKNFTWYWDRESGSSQNVRTLSFVDNDAKKTTIDINMPLKAVCDTDSKIYGSTVCKASFKKDQSKDPANTMNVTTSSWFDNMISSIFSNKKAETQLASKYKCINGVCKESLASDATTLEKCMPSCLGVTNQIPSFNFQSPATGSAKTMQSFDSGSMFNFSAGTSSSNLFGTSKSTTGRFSCDWTLQKCKPDPNGTSTDEGKCNESCKSKAFTNNSISFDSLSVFNSLNFVTSSAQSTKYKCDASNRCVEASNLDKNTFLKSECSTKCKTTPTVAPSSGTNSTNFNSNINFNINFNQ